MVKKPFVIDYHDIKLGKRIAAGGFGSIYKYSWLVFNFVRGRLYGQDVAVKTIKKKSDSEIEDFKKETRIMSELRHPNIVEFLGASTKPHMTIVTEYLSGGNLTKWMERRHKRKEPLSYSMVLSISLDIARGVNWLHHKGIIHRDLKPDNILLDEYKVKISDFGLAHIQSEKLTSVGFYGAVGTPCYMAPEVIGQQEYGVKADVFSFGVVMCELVTGNAFCISNAVGYYPFDKGGAPEDTYDFEQAIT